jgi:hypothetical protein
VISVTARMLGKPSSAWMAAAVVLGLASATRAQTPACGPETAGQLSDQAGVRCQCVVGAGGSITGEPSGYRWDCGILRGRMNQLVPASPNAYQGPLPEGIIVDPTEVPVEPQKPWFPGHRGLR